MTLRRKNQLTLPATVSDDLGLETGDSVYLQKVQGIYRLVTKNDVIDPSAGALAKYAAGKPPLTQEEMDQAVEDGILESWRRFEEEVEAERHK
jgi:bifunctional DNA-binding transcriptional regulator/antitoxin component of YhaV-PrlF toxin-antitoxin module